MIQDLQYANDMCLISDNMDEIEMMLQVMNEHKEIQDNGCVAISGCRQPTIITKTSADSTAV